MNPAHAILDNIVFKSGHYSNGVPASLAQSFLEAKLYVDEPGRSFKRRWSDPVKEMPADQMHFFSVAYHNDVPVGVAYFNMKKEYTCYTIPDSEDIIALANSNFGVYVNAKYRGCGIATAMAISVLEKALTGRGEEKPGVRMTANARRFCRYIIDLPNMSEHYISIDEVQEKLEAAGI